METCTCKLCIRTSIKEVYYSTPPIICFCTVPFQVTGVDVSKATRSGQPTLSVTWTTPTSELTISKYQVQYRRSGTKWRAANLVSPGSNTSTLLEALDAGTVYEVRIRAVSAIGNGPWSEVESETTYMSELCSEVKLVKTANIERGHYWEDRHSMNLSYDYKEIVVCRRRCSIRWVASFCWRGGGG